MKIILILLTICSFNVLGQGMYSNSEVYVVCDIPLNEYELYSENGYFRTESLGTEGFIHCARPSQLEYVMNKYFKADSYVLFISSRSLLGESLKYEGNDPNNLYPHLFRQFNKSDVIEQVIVNRSMNGEFILPRVLSL
jgi:uncharacterized protein (DUF952 family)